MATPVNEQSPLSSVTADSQLRCCIRATQRTRWWGSRASKPGDHRPITLAVAMPCTDGGRRFRCEQYAASHLHFALPDS